MHLNCRMITSTDLDASSIEFVARTCLCRRVQHASRAIGRRFDEAFRPIGINNWQFTLLMSLTPKDPQTINEVAAALGMDRTTTTKNLRPLERRGLVEIRADAHDGRVRRIVLTQAGRELLSDAMTRWARVNTEVAASLSEDEIGQLRDALEAIAVN